MRSLVYLILILQPLLLLAQTGDDNQNRPPQANNLQAYTPSVLLSQNQFEVKVFNNLYTDIRSYNADQVREDDANRESFFGSFISGLYGISERVNLGFDLYLRASATSPRSSSDFALFNTENQFQSRTAITKFGPRIKILPFEAAPRFSVQSTFLFPMADDLEGKLEPENPWLDWDSYTWINQIFYDYRLAPDWQLFSALEIFSRFPREGSFTEDPFVMTPLKGFLSYFPNQKITTYAMAEFAPRWGAEVIDTYYLQTGLGAKYQISNSFEVEALYTIFPAGKNQGAGTTYNVGLRYIHR